MPHRLFVDLPLAAGHALVLPPTAARHVQVLRLQPGDAITLFNGAGGEWSARVLEMQRQAVTVSVLAHDAVARELACDVTLALGMPANDRMDTLVEKAAELGAARIQPLLTERSVLRLSGERAERRRAHWQAVAIAACEQCGRTRVPVIAPVLGFDAWLAHENAPARWLLSPGATRALHTETVPQRLVVLSGPEGGLSPNEVQAALARGFVALGLGPRVLRADTAPLALLAWLALGSA